MSETVHYPLIPTPFTAVRINDNFWSPRLEINRTVTIPYDFQKCEETGRIGNFEKAAGLMEGDHEGLFYNDSDVFKVIEGAAYSLSIHPDPALEQYVDHLIDKIAAAQEEDGYLYTARTIAERSGHLDRLQADREGLTRWSNLRINHELYNVGHMYEAAVAYYQATGKRKFLDVAIKNADLIDRVFGPDKERDVPGHEEIEIGLVKLYRVSGDERYLKLAQFFLDERGHAHGRERYSLMDNPGYMQDHLPVVEQTEAVGHAVRAGYLYSSMADVAALTGNAAYVAALDRLWENVVSKKLYLTGGIGACHRGEAFGDNYELPNETAYAETCAAIANAMWNYRMFLLHGDARYIDVLERVLYNGFLSGVGFSGDRFFYVNPLAFDGEFRFNRDDSRTRQPWFRTSCCPTNVVRFLPSLAGYVYAHRDNQLLVNLFIGSHAAVVVAGQEVAVTQDTPYPWQGQVSMTVAPERPAAFTISVRIPGWSQGQPVPSDLYRYVHAEPAAVTLQVNGKTIPFTLSHGYAHVRRTWHAGDTLALDLPMPIRRVLSHEKVAANVGRVALERGPIVYCAEAMDNGGSVRDIVLADDVPLQAEHRPGLLNGVTAITGQLAGGRPFMAIPYYAWAHRDMGEMAVWLQRGS